MSINIENTTKDAKVLDFSSFRRKKSEEQDLTRGRSKPLYISHKEGNVTATPSGSLSSSTNENFGDRVSRIKASLDRINSLMAELKKISQHGQPEQSTKDKK